ncbi:hypothetical protein T439DRAFT_383936 [Meredithblackwellia eburnea MCA 4105]
MACPIPLPLDIFALIVHELASQLVNSKNVRDEPTLETRQTIYNCIFLNHEFHDLALPYLYRHTTLHYSFAHADRGLGSIHHLDACKSSNKASIRWLSISADVGSPISTHRSYATLLRTAPSILSLRIIRLPSTSLLHSFLGSTPLSAALTKLHLTKSTWDKWEMVFSALPALRDVQFDALLVWQVEKVPKQSHKQKRMKMYPVPGALNWSNLIVSIYDYNHFEDTILFPTLIAKFPPSLTNLSFQCYYDLPTSLASLPLLEKLSIRTQCFNDEYFERLLSLLAWTNCLPRLKHFALSVGEKWNNRLFNYLPQNMEEISLAAYQWDLRSAEVAVDGFRRFVDRCGGPKLRQVNLLEREQQGGQYDWIKDQIVEIPVEVVFKSESDLFPQFC